MAWFKKKTKPKQEPKSITIVGEDEVRDALKAIAELTPSPCPEVMQATNTCYCQGCESIGKCVVERMSRSLGCVGSFPVYCSTRDSKRDEPTYGWSHVVLRNVMPDVQAKYGIKELPEERTNGQKKTDDRRRTKRSNDRTT